MTHVLKGETDAGSMVLFDPSALPVDFDDRVKDDEIAVIEQSWNEGRLCWVNTEGDGAFTLRISVGEGLPTELARFVKEEETFIREEETIEYFELPSGRIHFAGIEHVFRNIDSPRAYPPMEESCEIPAGTYHLTMHELDYPEDFEESFLAQKLSARDDRLYALARRVIPALHFLGTVPSMLSLAFLELRIWSITLLPYWVSLMLVATLISNSRTCRHARYVLSTIKHEYPDFCVTLEAIQESSTCNVLE